MAPLRPGIISIGRATPEHNASHLIGCWPDIDLVKLAQDSSVNYDYNGTGQLRVGSEVWLLGNLLCVAVYARYYIGSLIDFFREEDQKSFSCIKAHLFKKFDARNYYTRVILLWWYFYSL